MRDTLFLVDDNPIQTICRRAILGSLFRQVVAAASASEALQLLGDAALTERIALVVTDHLMPGMNGPEFVRALSKIAGNLPVIVLSGMPDVEEEYNGLSVTYCQKPFPPEKLLALARKLAPEKLSVA